MTTASLQQRPASVIRARPTAPTILKRPREVKKKVANATKPVLLRNLRNYYARRRPSMSISNKAPPQEEPPTNRKVQFFPKVRVKRIPSRCSYSDEDRLSMWLPKKVLKQMVMRNHAEFAFEGQDWQNAPEETNGFAETGNGELVHPMYVWAEEQEQQEEEASSSSDDNAMLSPEDDSSESDDDDEAAASED